MIVNYLIQTFPKFRRWRRVTGPLTGGLYYKEHKPYYAKGISTYSCFQFCCVRHTKTLSVFVVFRGFSRDFFHEYRFHCQLISLISRFRWTGWLVDSTDPRQCLVIVFIDNILHKLIAGSRLAKRAKKQIVHFIFEWTLVKLNAQHWKLHTSDTLQTLAEHCDGQIEWENLWKYAHLE